MLKGLALANLDVEKAEKNFQAVTGGDALFLSVVYKVTHAISCTCYIILNHVILIYYLIYLTSVCPQQSVIQGSSSMHGTVQDLQR